MENLVIKPKNKAELKFLSDLLKKLSMDFRIMSEDEIEELEDLEDILAIQARKGEETINFDEFVSSLGYEKKSLATV